MTLRRSRVLSILVAFILFFGFSSSAYGEILDLPQEPEFEEPMDIEEGEEEEFIEEDLGLLEEEPLMMMESISLLSTPDGGGSFYTTDTGVYDLIGNSGNDHTNARYIWVNGNYLYVAITTQNVSLDDQGSSLTINGTVITMYDELPDVKFFPNDSYLVLKGPGGVTLVNQQPWGKVPNGNYFWMIAALPISSVPTTVTVTLDVAGGFAIYNVLYQVKGAFNVYHEYPPSPKILDTVQTVPSNSLEGLAAGNYPSMPVETGNFKYKSVKISVEGSTPFTVNKGDTISWPGPSGITINVDALGNVSAILSSSIDKEINVEYLYYEPIGITVTASSHSETYDGSPLTGSYSLTSGSLRSGDYLDVSLSGSITNVGSTGNIITDVKVFDASDVDVTNLYAITEVDGTLTINARPLTITADSDSKIYDGSALTDDGYTIPSGTLADGETLESVVVTGSQTNVGSSDNIASAAVIKKGAVDTTSNYNITYVKGTLTVNAKAVTINVDNSSKVFGDPDPTFTGSPVGLIDNDDLGTISYFRTNSDVQAVGSYPAVLDAKYTPNPNYTVTVNKGNFTITTATGAALNITNYTGTYDGLYHSITVTNANDPGDTIYYRESPSGTWTTSKPTYKNVGVYDVYVKVTNPNFDDRLGQGLVTINKIDIEIKAKSTSKVYDGQPLTLNDYEVSGTFVTGEGFDSVVVTGTITFPGSVPNVLESYTLKSGTLAGNYNITKKNGTLTITAASIPITVTADDASKTYDGTSLTKNTYTSSGTLVSGDTLQVVISGTITDFGTTPNVLSSVKVMNGLVDVTENYNITKNNGTLTINKKDVTITVDDKSKVFGQSDPTFTGNVVGVVAGDDLGVSYIRTNAGVESVGTYPDVLSANYTANANYNVTIIKGDFQITPATAAPLSVTGYTGTYDALPHGVTVTGQVPGDLVEYSLDQVTWVEINPQFTNVSTTTVYVRTTNPNYTGRTGSAVVKINARPLEVTAASDDKLYDGTPLTNNGYSITDGTLVEGQSLFSVTVTGSQTNVGSSANVPSNAVIIDGEDDVTSNYSVTYENGLLRVDPTTGPSLIVESYNGVYDGEFHGINLDGIIDGDEVFFYLLGEEDDLDELDWDELDWMDENPMFKNVGSHMILVKVVNSNYNDRTGTGTVNITPRPISITAGSATKVFDNQPLTNNSYTLTSGTIVEGEELFDVTVTGTITQVGSVPNVPSNAEIGIIEGPDTTSNYAITYVNGTLTITQPFIPPTLYQVNFVAGNGGSLEGTTTTNAIAGTVWSMITVPTPVADEGFEFIGWSPDFPTNIYQNWTFTADFQELEIEIIEEPIPEAPPVEEEEEVVEIIEEPIPEATPILPRTGQSDPMFLYGIGALLSGLLLRRKRR